MTKLLTFHKILPGCEEGNSEAWTAFLADYTPMVVHFFGIYTPWAPDAVLDSWRDALRALSANDCATLRGFSHQSEREFLVDLRAFLQGWAAGKIEASRDAANPPAPTVETLGALLKGLPLLHQEIAFLTLAGYSQSTLEKLLRTTPAVADEGLGRLRSSYAPVLEYEAWTAACGPQHGWESAKQRGQTGRRIARLSGSSSGFWMAKRAGTTKTLRKSTAPSASIAWNSGRRCSKLSPGTGHASAGQKR